MYTTLPAQKRPFWLVLKKKITYFIPQWLQQLHFPLVWMKLCHSTLAYLLKKRHAPVGTQRNGYVLVNCFGQFWALSMFYFFLQDGVPIYIFPVYVLLNNGDVYTFSCSVQSNRFFKDQKFSTYGIQIYVCFHISLIAQGDQKYL